MVTDTAVVAPHVGAPVTKTRKAALRRVGVESILATVSLTATRGAETQLTENAMLQIVP